jgi:predicted DsbA family dithiol-disulfide isomerase
MTESTGEPMALRIDVVSDVVCPWCIIGYKQLQKALALVPGEFEVDLHWHPFELNMQMPEEGQDLREHIAMKYGTTPEQSQAARQRLMDLGKALDFSFDYSDGMRMVNTFRAHQLLTWAAEQGKQTQLKLALFEAFFTQRQDVNDPEVLVAVAQSVGLPAEQATALLADGRYAKQVRAEEELWMDRGIHAVPAFVFNNQFMVPGAQEPETFVQVLEKVKAGSSAEAVT